MVVSRAKDAELRARAQAVLARSREALHADGSDVILLRVQAGVVVLRLSGDVLDCPMSSAAAMAGLEATLRDALRGQVLAVVFDPPLP